MPATVAQVRVQGNEKARIERSQPIWCLQWSPVSSEGLSTLVVGCWDQTLSFWQVNGQQVGKDRTLGTFVRLHVGLYRRARRYH